jgi:threonine efflux protein
VLTMLVSVGLVHWVILITPGPNVLLVSHLAASGQRKAAFWAGMGISAVAVGWAMVAMLGINALFAAQPGIRLGVQVAGGLYLCYLARRMWLSSAPTPLGKTRGAAGDGPGAAAALPMTAPAALRMGLVTNLLNPKSVVMFSSLFVAALPAQLPLHQQAAVLGMVLCNAVLWHGFLAGACSHPAVQAVYARQRRWLGRLAGVCLGLFGARLLWASARD